MQVITGFASGAGGCVGIVEPFKNLLHAIGHPQFLVLELQAYGRLPWTIQKWIPPNSLLEVQGDI